MAEWISRPILKVAPFLVDGVDLLGDAQLGFNFPEALMDVDDVKVQLVLGDFQLFESLGIYVECPGVFPEIEAHSGDDPVGQVYHAGEMQVRFGLHGCVLKFDRDSDIFREIPFFEQSGPYLGMIETQDAVFALKEADALLFHACKHLFIPICKVLVKDDFTYGM